MCQLTVQEHLDVLELLLLKYCQDFDLSRASLVLNVGDLVLAADEKGGYYTFVVSMRQELAADFYLVHQVESPEAAASLL